MRLNRSGSITLLGIASIAAHPLPSFRMHSPGGSLAAVIKQIGAQADVTIVTDDPALLQRRVDRTDISGDVSSLLARLGRMAGFTAKRTGAQSWRLIELARRRDERPRQAPAPPASDAPAILVQATKQQESWLRSPTDIVRVTGDTLSRFGQPADTAAIEAAVPILSATGWGPGREKLFLRGIADSSFIGNSPALVGQYLGDQRITYSAPDPDLRLYDMQSVEVLAGAQGTLYGAASLAGILRIEPTPPQLDRASASLSGGISSVAHGSAGSDMAGVVNLPLIADAAALRLVGYAATDPGYIDDIERGLHAVNRTRTIGGRAAIRGRIGQDWTLTVSMAVQRITNRDAPYADRTIGPLERATDIAQPSHNHFLSTALAVQGSLGGLTVQSTTGWVRQNLRDLYAVEQLIGGSYTTLQQDAPTLLTEDVRVSSRTGKLSWVIGGSLLRAVDHDTHLYKSHVASLRTLARNRLFEATVYGETSWRLGGYGALTAGLRYAADAMDGHATQERTPPLVPDSDDHVRSDNQRIQPEAALSLYPMPRMTAYVRLAGGYRPGGITSGQSVQRYDGDSMATWEIGLRRGVPGEDRFAFQLSASTSRWRHIQSDLLDGLGIPYVSNIGNGLVQTIDASADFDASERLSLHMSGFVTRSRLHYAGIDEVEVSDTLPNVARNGLSASIRFSPLEDARRDLAVEFRANHVGPSVALDTGLFIRQGDSTTIGLGARLQAGRSAVTLAIDNLLDSHAIEFAMGTPHALMDREEATPLRPRTIRLGAAYRF
jgi:outer membrane receptor protein involved in Fe transport